MEYRQLGGSGFKVPVLSLGTGTFGGTNEFFKGEPLGVGKERSQCGVIGLHVLDGRWIHIREQRREFHRRLTGLNGVHRSVRRRRLRSFGDSRGQRSADLGDHRSQSRRDLLHR